jgi:hypothetical protein
LIDYLLEVDKLNPPGKPHAFETRRMSLGKAAFQHTHYELPVCVSVMAITLLSKASDPLTI